MERGSGRTRGSDGRRDRPRADAPLVTACIIARDEERVLGRCLESIAGACDEICVVDTGSKDRTVSIARSGGARVMTFTRCNDRRGRMRDFSMARNAALGMATGSWVLWIDADEVLSGRSGARIRRHAAAGRCSAVWVTVRSGHARWPVVRLFARQAGAHFRGIVHEWIAVDGPACEDRRIVIENLPDKAGKESAVDRDVRLCTLALRRDRRDARATLYLARARQKDGRYERAVELYRAYHRLARGFRAGRHLARHSIAVCRLLSGRWRQAAEEAREALRVDAARAESYCVLGDALVALGDVDGARVAFRKALTCRSSGDHPLFVDDRFAHGYPRRRLRELP